MNLSLVKDGLRRSIIGYVGEIMAVGGVHCHACMYVRTSESLPRMCVRVCAGVCSD